tara:strand:- start:5 stop:280 length:276 start_codon:yes stop_codon:yes gene_type:complete
MIKRNFRTVGKTEVKAGLAIWLDGRFFEDTNPIGPKPNDDTNPVCGPFLVERVLFGNHQGIREPRVDLVDPETGRRRSMMSSWLLVPKEGK